MLGQAKDPGVSWRNFGGVCIAEATRWKGKWIDQKGDLQERKEGSQALTPVPLRQDGRGDRGAKIP